MIRYAKLRESWTMKELKARAFGGSDGALRSRGSCIVHAERRSQQL